VLPLAFSSIGEDPMTSWLTDLLLRVFL